MIIYDVDFMLTIGSLGVVAPLFTPADEGKREPKGTADAAASKVPITLAVMNINRPGTKTSAIAVESSHTDGIQFVELANAHRCAVALCYLHNCGKWSFAMFAYQSHVSGINKSLLFDRLMRLYISLRERWLIIIQTALL